MQVPFSPALSGASSAATSSPPNLPQFSSRGKKRRKAESLKRAINQLPPSSIDSGALQPAVIAHLRRTLHQKGKALMPVYTTLQAGSSTPGDRLQFAQPNLSITRDPQEATRVEIKGVQSIHIPREEVEAARAANQQGRHVKVNRWYLGESEMTVGNVSPDVGALDLPGHVARNGILVPRPNCFAIVPRTLIDSGIRGEHDYATFNVPVVKVTADGKIQPVLHGTDTHTDHVVDEPARQRLIRQAIRRIEAEEVARQEREALRHKGPADWD
jgi:hypothetical protein